MIVTPIEHDLQLALPNPETAQRSPGLHMSDLYSSLYQELEPKRFRKDTPLDAKRLEMGLMWEELLEVGLANRLGDQFGERPGEFSIVVEGTPIYYTPDLLLWDDDGEMRLGEIKLTWMSSREVPRKADVDNFPSKFDKYFTQMKAYCYALGITRARLYIMFVNGNYRPPSPELLAWDIEFSKQEIDENFSMLINHGKDVGLL